MTSPPNGRTVTRDPISAAMPRRSSTPAKCAPAVAPRAGSACATDTAASRLAAAPRPSRCRAPRPPCAPPTQPRWSRAPTEPGIDLPPCRGRHAGLAQDHHVGGRAGEHAVTQGADRIELGFERVAAGSTAETASSRRTAACTAPAASTRTSSARAGKAARRAGAAPNKLQHAGLDDADVAALVTAASPRARACASSRTVLAEVVAGLLGVLALRALSARPPGTRRRAGSEATSIGSGLPPSAARTRLS